jgi:PIN domain nuclease of toxin-antitoxin system
MNYLLASYALLWSIIDPQKLSSKARKIIENPEHTILVSAVSIWEISLKYALGKLDLWGITPNEILGLIEETGFELISLVPEESASYCYLEASWHRDPFDRMLIW